MLDGTQGRHAGREALRSGVGPVWAAEGPATLHLTLNPVVEPGPSGDQAIVRSVLLIVDLAPPPAILAAAAITQELRRAEGSWRITRRAVAPASSHKLALGGSERAGQSRPGRARTPIRSPSSGPKRMSRTCGRRPASCCADRITHTARVLHRRQVFADVSGLESLTLEPPALSRVRAIGGAYIARAAVTFPAADSPGGLPVSGNCRQAGTGSTGAMRKSGDTCEAVEAVLSFGPLVDDPDMTVKNLNGD